MFFTLSQHSTCGKYIERVPSSLVWLDPVLKELVLIHTSIVLSCAVICRTKVCPFGNLVPRNATTQQGLETCSLLSTCCQNHPVTLWIPNTLIPASSEYQNSMGVRYSNGKVTWLGGPFEYRTFRTINRLFQSGFQTTIWIPDHLTTRHKSTIWIPD